jgi:aminomethyltransferase
MGYCAWGAELDADISPAEAGLGWIVAFDKGTRFVGEAALRAERRRGLTRCLVGVRADPADAVVEAGDQVIARGRVVDRVRSAAFGPSVGGTVGLVYVPVAFAEPGTRLEAVGPRGTTATLVVTSRPFYRGGSRHRA